MVAAKAAVICGKSQYAPNPPNAGKPMIFAGHEVAEQIVHSAVCSGAARHSKGADSARAQLLANASTESTQSLSASAPNDGDVAVNVVGSVVADETRTARSALVLASAELECSA